MHEPGLYDLVARAKSGESAAVGELFLRSEEELRRYARALLGANWDHKSNSDLIQDTWKKALTALADFRGGPDDRQTAAMLRSWLKQIVRYTYLNELRADRRTPGPTVSLDSPGDDSAAEAGLEPAANTPSPSASLRRRETRRKVHEVLARLPDEQREVVRLALLEERTFVEIAGLLGCDESTARYRLRTALPRLRELLKELP